MYKVYLDNCCLNRPFDDQSQDRVRLESEAVLTIMAHLSEDRWHWVGSDILTYEMAKVRDLTRRERLLSFLKKMQTVVSLEQIDSDRANMLKACGFKAIDALHVVCAETAGCDVLLTTDDNMLALGKRLRDIVRVWIESPVIWLNEVLAP